MKRFMVGFVAAVLAAVGSASMAEASDGATTTHFTAAYPGAIGDLWACSGSHIVKAAPKAFVKDSETCIVSGDVSRFYSGTFSSTVPCPESYGYPTYTGCGSFPPYANTPGTIDALVNWYSDFNGAFATTWNMTIARNADGTFTAQIDSYYLS